MQIDHRLLGSHLQISRRWTDTKWYLQQWISIRSSNKTFLYCHIYNTQCTNGAVNFIEQNERLING